MNEEILHLFTEYSTQPMMRSQVAAAVLTLAEMVSRLTPEPIIVEPDDRQTYGVKEAAELLQTSSKKVYLMCLAGTLRCVRIGGRVRIPIDEIERFQTGPGSASTALAFRDHQ
jgi:excisionase family DNA binding protein